MNAIKFLLHEHNKIRTAFKNIHGSSRIKTKQRLFAKLAKKLVVHETMEQKKWYPKIKKELSNNALLKHLVSEEKSAAKAIKKLQKISSENKWLEKFEALNEDVEHHAVEEEEELFPLVGMSLGRQTLMEIGKVLNQYKTQHERGLLGIKNGKGKKPHRSKANKKKVASKP